MYYIFLQVASSFCYLPVLRVWEEKENASRVVFPVKFKVTALPGLEQVHPLHYLWVRTLSRWEGQSGVCEVLWPSLCETGDSPTASLYYRMGVQMAHGVCNFEYKIIYDSD